MWNTCSSIIHDGKVYLTHQVESTLQMLFTAISTRMVLCSTLGPYLVEFRRSALCERSALQLPAGC